MLEQSLVFLLYFKLIPIFKVTGLVLPGEILQSDYKTEEQNFSKSQTTVQVEHPHSDLRSKTFEQKLQTISHFQCSEHSGLQISRLGMLK